MRQLLLDIRPLDPPDLDRFIVGRNHELMRHLQAMLNGTAAERMIYLWGEPGCGKSYLLEAWANACRVRGLRAATHVDDDAPVTAIDDIHNLAGAQQLAVFARYNKVRETGGSWIATGRHPPAETALMPELRTRLGWGLVFQVQGLDDAEKRDALTHHAARLGFALEPQIADYLLTHAPRDMGRLLQLLEALDRLSLETRRPVTLPLVRQLIAA